MANVRSIYEEHQNNYYPLISPDCYIYLHHARADVNSSKLGLMIVLPSYPDTTDYINVEYSSSTPLSRTAPIYSWVRSGPRSIQVTFKLHRDMMKEINSTNGQINLEDDYVDLMIKLIQACALPTYTDTSKLVNPPLVSLKLGNDIFIKGIVQGNVGVSYGLPILSNGKYARVDISFNVLEVTPYDADHVIRYGSLRGLESLDKWTT